MTDDRTSNGDEAAATDGNDGRDRAFVLGFDGIPWNLIEKWATAGHLPHFASIIEDGCAGPLRSTSPPTTSLAWPSIATGTWPDKHGIYGFQKLSDEYTHRMYTSADRRQPALWDVLSPAVVGNVPMTYPAGEIDGRMVTGMMTPAMDTGFTHPSDLASEIAARIPEYEIGLDWSDYAGEDEAFVADMESLVGKRRELMGLLMEERDWRLFFFVYTAPDRLQHLVWDESVLLEHYRQMDDVLGEAMSYVSDRGGTLYVVSDHGFGPISTFVYVNRVLEREGYLSRRASKTRGTLARFGIDRERIHDLLAAVGISDQALVRYLPRRFVDSVAEQVAGDHSLYDVDFERTTAFLTGIGTVYVNDTERFANGQVAPSEVPELKRELQATLAALTDPATGDPVLTVYDGDELYPADDRSPDVIVSGIEEFEPAKSLSDVVFADTGTKVASHRPEGIFLAWGPTIEAGSTPSEATVVDVAPTVLHGTGEPIPERADGRVLEEVFAPESEPARRSVQRRAYARGDARTVADDDFDGVEDRLRGLGYLE